MGQERPSLLIHAYLNDREGRDIPDRLTRMGILAAGELYRHGEAEKVYITAVPELATTIEKRLKSLLSSIPNEDVIVRPFAKTTKQELFTFKKAAETENSGSLICIANEAHVPRVKKLVRLMFGEKEKIQVIDIDDILEKYPRYRGIISESKNWPEQISLQIKENTIKKLTETPLIGRFVLLHVTEWLGGVSFQKHILGHWERRISSSHN
jgi:hypothetical protein